MRNVIGKSVAIAVLGLGISASQAFATQEIVNVPFPFIVNGRTLPAGEYVVQSLEGDPNVVLIQGRHRDHKQSAVVMTNPASGHDPAGNSPSLTFTRQDNQYRLSSVWESATEGRAVTGS